MTVTRALPCSILFAILACGDDTGSRRAETSTVDTFDVSPDAADAADATANDADASGDVPPSDTTADDAGPDVGPQDAAPDDVDGLGDAVTDSVDEEADATAPDAQGDADGGGEVEWSEVFDPAGLLEGAASKVPDAIMAQWPALLGGAMHRDSAITGVEFHIPGVISSTALSPVPIPVRKEVDGVAFWQVSGEISARVQDDWGIDFAIGPIDAHGVNHRAEVYDPFEPTAEHPDDPRSHPRAGLPGAIFYVRWPVEGFNGGLVQMQAAGDAGNGYPQALLAWWPVDPLVLLERGYAVASVAGGGTVYGRKDEAGGIVVDTNPESGSDIFFTVDPELATWQDVYETERTKLVSAMRPMYVDRATLDETSPPTVTEVELVFPGYDPETDTWFEDRVVDNVTHPDRPFPIALFGTELVSDAVVFFDNLLVQATGHEDIWALYLGWSGSGHTAWSIATGTISLGGFQFPKALGVPPSGGNFRKWKDPASGVRFDAFLVYSGARPAPTWTDSAGVAEIAGHVPVDPDYPLSAPYVWVRGDVDVLLGNYGDDFWANAFLQSNAVARAWATSALADRALDDTMAIYELAMVNHQARDQLFPLWDRPPFDAHAVWYDPALGYDFAALNTERRGLRISEVYARQVLAHGDEIQYYANDLRTSPRITPFMVSLVGSLRAATEEGGKLPVSRVGPLLASVDALDETTALPPYPMPCGDLDGAPWEDILACRDRLEGHATLSQRTLLDFEIAAAHEFVRDNPLSRVPETVVVPDVAAPLGWLFAVYGVVLRRDFDAAELASRYGDHAGWVEAFAAATDALVGAGLWDAALGQIYVDQAEALGLPTE